MYRSVPDDGIYNTILAHAISEEISNLDHDPGKVSAKCWIQVGRCRKTSSWLTNSSHGRTKDETSSLSLSFEEVVRCLGVFVPFRVEYD